MKQIKILALPFIFAGILSCSNDDEVNCSDSTIETTSLENEYACINTPYQMDIELSEDYMIIGNQTEFLDLVTGSCLPDIDFSNYDLVIGKKGLSNGIDSINYVLIENCENESQILTVTFNKNATTEAPNLTYHALIPKLANEQEFSLVIEEN
jgi:hypothetical protein